MTPARAGRAELSLWLTCLACTIPGWLAIAGQPPSRIAAGVAFAFLPYAWLLMVADTLPSVRALSLATWAAFAAGLVLVLSPPALSDDLYRYLWDGRVLGHGLDPYAHAPNDPALRALRDAPWAHVNHRELRTIYPPLAQLFFGVADWIAHSPITFKLGTLCAHLLAIRAVAALSAASASRAVVAYALNPLALSESALNGHVDVIAGAALAVGVLQLSSARGARASGAIALAAGTKLVGLLLLPLSARLGVKRCLVSALWCLLVLAPMLVPHAAETSGAMNYAQRWQGNDALFGVIERGVALGLGALATPEELARGHLKVSAIAPLLERMRGSAIDPWASADAAHLEIPDRSDFEIGFLAGLVTRVLVLCLAAALALALAASKLSVLSAARFTVLGTLLLAPQIHPWYLLWLLPLEAAAGGLGGITWSVSVLLAYAPLDLWQRARIWNESNLAKLCEFGLVGLVFVVEARLFKRERPDRYAGLSTLPDRPGDP